MLQTEKSLIKLRIDVDYAYPSRIKSFIYTALNLKGGRDYLKNSKTLARMINESPEEVKAYWFFTTKTIPDEELLVMLNAERHEVALHVINHPYEEMKILEETTGRKTNYYTIHGTSRLIGRILWKRWKINAPAVPRNFPLQSFHEFPTLSLDALCYTKSTAKAVEIAEESIALGKAVEIHPEWLFRRGKINQRGAFYATLKKILNANEEIKNLVVRKKLFFRIARNAREYEKDICPTEALFEKLQERRVDVFTFIERKWHRTIPNPPSDWSKIEDNIALLQVPSYDKWWSEIGKKTRNMVRKAERSGVTIKVTVANEELAKGIWKIYNETPIRQGRVFPHYGMKLENVKRSVLSSENSTFIGAYFDCKLVGFIQLIHGDDTVIISQILSLQAQRDKAVNNALLAKSIEVCADQQINWLMYGRMGNHPSLDRFKRNHGFAEFSLTRYYLPLTTKGKMVIRLGLHREIKDALPQRIKYAFIPIYNWISRTKTRHISSKRNIE